MFVIIAISLLCWTGILWGGASRDDAIGIVLNEILNEDSAYVNVFASIDSIFATDSVRTWESKVPNPNDSSWVFFIDDIPSALWSHSNRYIFIDLNDSTYTTHSDSLPPFFLDDFEFISGTAEYDTTDTSSPRSIASRTYNPHLYAVLINGNYNDARTAFFNDISANYIALTDVMGYDPDNIYIHTGDGTQGPSNPHGIDFNGDDLNEDVLMCDKATISETFDNLSEILDESDQLFIFITGHGSTNVMGSYVESYIYTWASSEYYINNCIGLTFEECIDLTKITSSELNSMLTPIVSSQIIITMQNCHSGGFITPVGTPPSNIAVTGDHRTIHTVGTQLESGYTEKWINPNLKYHEYFYYWNSVVRGAYPDPYFAYLQVYGLLEDMDFDPFFDENPDYDCDPPPHPEPYDPDTNEDNFLQLGEIFDFVDNFDTYSGDEIENNYFASYFCYITYTPQQYSNTGFSLDLLTLEGFAGSVTENQTIEGAFLIGGDLTIDDGVELTIDTSSEDAFLTLYSSIYVDAGAEFDIGDETTILTENDSYIYLDVTAMLTLGDDITIDSNAPVLGCTDSEASHYNANANIDIGNCDMILGDVNADVALDVLDVLIIVDIVLYGVSVYTPYQLWAADYNQDDTINILDVVGTIFEILDDTEDYAPEGTVFITKTIKAAGNPPWVMEIKMINEPIVKGMQMSVELDAGYKAINVKRGEYADTSGMSLAYKISQDSTEVNYLYYGPDGEEFPADSLGIILKICMIYQGSPRSVFNAESGHISNMIFANSGNYELDHQELNNDAFNEIVNDEYNPNSSAIISEFRLHSVFPNPFNPVTTVQYELPERGLVNIAVYDVVGREVTQLVNTYKEEGYHSVMWNATSYASGAYFVKMTSGDFTQTQKVMLVK